MMAASDADALRQLMRLGTAPQRQDLRHEKFPNNCAGVREALLNP
jgi:hypothetical protein